MSAPYRSNDAARSGGAHAWWSVRAASLWFLVISAWLLVGSCGLREPYPTLFCERTGSTTRCWYDDDAAYFPSVRSLDGVTIRVAPTSDTRREGLYFGDAHSATLVTGRSPRGVIVAPILASNGGCVTHAHDAADAFFAGRAGPRLALRLNDNDLGSIVMPFAGFVPLLLTLVGLIAVMAELLLRTHRVVVDARTRSVSIAFLWEHPLKIQLAPGEVLATAGDVVDHRIVVSSQGGATSAIHTDARLSPLARGALVERVNLALSGERRIATGWPASTIVAALLVGAALTVIFGRELRRDPMPEWVTRSRAACP